MKKTYDVAVTETRERIVTVEASDLSEAEMKVREAYQNGEITLDQDDIFFTEFTPFARRCHI